MLEIAHGVLETAHGVLETAHGILDVTHGVLEITHRFLDSAYTVSCFFSRLPSSDFRLNNYNQKEKETEFLQFLSNIGSYKNLFQENI